MRITAFKYVLLLLTFTEINYGLARTSNTVAEPGKTTADIVSKYDSTQRYAIYLPSNYVPIKQWPVLCIMDPRSRAVYALDLYKKSAEELGYILISSYNTMSDVPNHPNDRALEAMMNDAITQYSVDQRRFYLSGFSGTTTVAWNLAYQLGDLVAGIFGFGKEISLTSFVFSNGTNQTKPIPFYGGSGYRDFNYFLIRSTESKMRQSNYPSRFSFFEGTHAWPPATECNKVLYWAHLNAMKNGQIPVDVGVIRDFYKSEYSIADSLDLNKDFFKAYEAFNNVVNDFEGLTNVSDATSRRDKLASLLEVQETKKLLEDQIANYLEEDLSYNRYFIDLRSKKKVQDHEKMVKRLKIEEHKAIVSGNANKNEKRYSSVILEDQYILTSYYEPTYYHQQKQYAHALSMLKLAEIIKPENTWVCLQKARTLTLMNDYTSAIEALDCLSGSPGAVPYVLQDTVLKKLGKEQAFKDLISSIEQ